MPCNLPNLGTTDCVGPSLRLDVNHVQSKSILFDDPVNALISGTSDGLPRVEQRAAVPHLDEKLHDDPLEELRGTCLNTFQQIGRKRSFELLESLLDQVLRSPVGWGYRRLSGSGACDGTSRQGPLPREKVNEFGKLTEIPVVYFLPGRECLRASLCDPENASTWRLEETSFPQVGARPSDTVIKKTLRSTRNQFLDRRQINGSDPPTQ
jgi:hypothetical protein